MVFVDEFDSDDRIVGGERGAFANASVGTAANGLGDDLER